MRATHQLIAKTAKEMAAAAYEELAKDNAFYAANPDRRKFVRRLWSTLVPHARRTLAVMLAGNYPQPMKDEIYEALSKDWALNGPVVSTATH